MKAYLTFYILFMQGKQTSILVAVTFIFSALSFIPLESVHAVAGQWSSSGSNIFYNDGRVGLGTTTPQSSLHVTGQIRSDAGYFIKDKQALLYSNYDGGNMALKSNKHISLWLGDDFGASQVRVTNNFGVKLLSVNSNGEMAFKDNMKLWYSTWDGGNSVLKTNKHASVWLGDNNGLSEFRVVKDSGAEVFSVNSEGTVRARQIIVSNSWADYVFEEDYKLMSFTALETYIANNNHLPNIPSASEIESHGISLGDMQRLQMEKIEELTLYILQLETRLKEVENVSNIGKE